MCRCLGLARNCRRTRHLAARHHPPEKVKNAGSARGTGSNRGNLAEDTDEGRGGSLSTGKNVQREARDRMHSEEQPTLRLLCYGKSEKVKVRLSRTKRTKTKQTNKKKSTNKRGRGMKRRGIEADIETPRR